MHQIRQPRDHTFHTAGEAWAWAIPFIEKYGSDVKTEDGALTREYRNLLITVEEPGLGWPIPGSKWDIAALEIYGDQLLSGENPGFDYTYGERLMHAYCVVKGINQIEMSIKMLFENPNTRRAPMFIWMPPIDLEKPGHHPCMLIVDPLIRGGQLHLAAMFRSHDILQAYPQNLYGLWRLQCYMAGKIRDGGVQISTGEITTWSVSAHYYYK